MRSFLCLFLVPLIALVKSESGESSSEESTPLMTLEYICGVVIDDDRETECRTCADKAIEDANIVFEGDQDRYESEAKAVMNACSNTISKDAENCVNEVEPVTCLNEKIRNKESLMVGLGACLDENGLDDIGKINCFKCVYLATLKSLNTLSQTTLGIVSVRKPELEDVIATAIYNSCSAHINEQVLSEIFEDSSE